MTFFGAETTKGNTVPLKAFHSVSVVFRKSSVIVQEATGRIQKPPGKVCGHA